ncbi:DUF3105 domain-containing protein [Nocardioides sp. URHA0032]|uniref:DUF3105 domain-containing protein n=1 Tax=Nocardioides sp. URHA0032 TaxID=1380388 RepID=UPI000684D8CB|nr:DUF3105 domain-containing protein [Nocardioides sp. URHA0032]
MSDLPTVPPPAYPPPAPPPPPQPVRRRRLPVVLAVVVAALLVGMAVTLPYLISDEPPEQARDGAVSLAEVAVYDDLQAAHTTADVDYPQSPPVGGPHDRAWLDCGVYGEPVRDENAVHDLEHGTVWITYDPEARVDLAALEAALPQNGIISPYDGLDAPVVVTVWGRQLALDGADDPRLALFIDTFGGGETAPEPFASCAGGVRAGDGQQGTDV